MSRLVDVDLDELEVATRDFVYGDSPPSKEAITKLELLGILSFYTHEQVSTIGALRLMGVDINELYEKGRLRFGGENNRHMAERTVGTLSPIDRRARVVTKRGCSQVQLSDDGRFRLRALVDDWRYITQSPQSPRYDETGEVVYSQ